MNTSMHAGLGCRNPRARSKARAVPCGRTFQLFGIDVVVDGQVDTAHVMEINSDPGMYPWMSEVRAATPRQTRASCGPEARRLVQTASLPPRIEALTRFGAGSSTQYFRIDLRVLWSILRWLCTPTHVRCTAS